MIEVFKTNVNNEPEAMRIISELVNKFPGSEINFDLEDCDKILRIEAGKIFPDEIISTLGKSGFQCEVLK